MRAVHQLDTVLRAVIADMGLLWSEKAVLEQPKDPKHGDIASNIALVLAREAQQNPRALAHVIAERLRQLLPVRSVDVAGPGFLNVTFHEDVWRAVVRDIEAAGTRFGASALGAGQKIQVEYVSANPTGPLHVGHGRGAAVGDSLARILRFAGFDVTTEYYINDAGRQMRLLGLSVWLRVQELAGKHCDWPEDWYRGAYIIDIAKELLARHPTLHTLPDEQGIAECSVCAAQSILDGIKADLAHFRVEHQVWFSEASLLERGAVQAAFDQLHQSQDTLVPPNADARCALCDGCQRRGRLFTAQGALWFATMPLGDDKDRVLRKSDKSLTYFASDIAYHNDKFQRGFDTVIDIWGADHHGYIPRMRAAVAALGRERADFDVVLIQLVNLLDNGVPVSMSTRAGTFETLADVVQEVGVDAARFMFLFRKSDSPLDFDLELVKQRTLDNPVYYVQYAHARIWAVYRRAQERGIALPNSEKAWIATRAMPARNDIGVGSCHCEEREARRGNLSPLNTPEDMALLRMAARFEDVVATAARLRAPHHISHYLMELAALLHSYYGKHQVLLEDDMPTTQARLALLRAVGQVLHNGLDLLGVDAPQKM